MRQFKKIIKTRIADFNFSIRVADKKLYEKLAPHYSNCSFRDSPDVFIEVRADKFPFPPAKYLKVSRGQYGFGKKGGKWFFVMGRRILAIFDGPQKRVTCFLGRGDFPSFSHLHFIILNNLLSKNQGAILHACGVKINGSGALFMAPSEGGKTTLGKLCGKKRIINDDVILIKRKNGHFVMNPLPWGGRIRSRVYKDVVLDRIFFLSKAKENFLAPLDRNEVIIKLFNGRIYPFWFEKMPFLQDLLDFNINLTSAISCYNLDFKPTPEVVDCLTR